MRRARNRAAIAGLVGRGLEVVVRELGRGSRYETHTRQRKVNTGPARLGPAARSVPAPRPSRRKRHDLDQAPGRVVDVGTGRAPVLTAGVDLVTGVLKSRSLERALGPPLPNR
jgi:hypothetical protein